MNKPGYLRRFPTDFYHPAYCDYCPDYVEVSVLVQAERIVVKHHYIRPEVNPVKKKAIVGKGVRI